MSRTGQTGDATYVTRTNLLKAKTFATFARAYPTTPEFIQVNNRESEYQYKRVGQQLPDCCCTQLGPVQNITIVRWDYIDQRWQSTITWSPVKGATSYKVTSNQPDQQVVFNGATSILYSTAWNVGNSIDITIIAINECSQSSGIVTAAPCFLAGSLVSMADGTTKPIEDVQVGERVIGAFGEINEVLALHRPLLGEFTMTKINDEHSTSSHHPHISVDKQFYCMTPTVVDNQLSGGTYEVINGEGNKEMRQLLGLKPGRVQQLEEGISLKTIEGSREVKTLEVYTMPPDTQLYNLVISGSHTYYVDGYAVTGWPREDDFNYDSWSPLA
jgi:hypothetical protein